MSTTKVPPPRKLTDKEDLDSFEDFWFQIETYYGRDPNFAQFINDPNLRWESRTVNHRGLSDAATAAHLNTFLRALATYALGPYIKQNILENVTSLSQAKREFMKLLEIDVSDSTFMDFYTIRRRANERPLMFYHRLRYHAERHLLQAGDRVGGVALRHDEQFSPTLERVVILEWLRRIDERLLKFVQEKFATELNLGRSTLMALVESLAKNIDTYLSGMNRGASVGVTYPTEPPVTQHTDHYQYSGGEHQLYPHYSQVCQQSGDVGYGYAGRGRGFQPRGQFQSQGFVPRYPQQPRPQPQFRPRGGFPQGGNRFPRQPGPGPVCEFCFLQVQTRRNPSLDYHHSIKNCEQVGQMQNRSRVGYTVEQTALEENHEFAQFVEDFTEVGLSDSQEQL